jgi:aminoglycoside phosphotransferase (APT) family kinase protein
VQIERFLPETVVGGVEEVRPISMGLSGAGVWAVRTTRGELVLRVQPERADPTAWGQQLIVLRRAAAAGVAPGIVHVDEDGRAVVSHRVAGVPFAAALGDPAQRGPAVASLVAQLRRLHALDASGVAERDPVAYARTQYAAQRGRPGFPAWIAELEPVFAAIEATVDARRVVSHNDVNPGNVLWDGARAWLVDWEVAGLTHPFYDLATLAMFIQLDEPTAMALLTAQEGVPPGDGARTVFSALRRLAALLCGLTFAGMVPDLGALPSPPPTLAAFYADLRAGKLRLGSREGQAAFAAALLGVGVRVGASRT